MRRGRYEGGEDIAKEGKLRREKYDKESKSTEREEGRVTRRKW